MSTCLPARVRELDSGDGALAPDETGNPGEHLDMLVLPNAQIRISDAAVCLDRARL